MCKIHFHKVILTQCCVKKNYYSPFGLWVQDPMACAVKLQFKILNKQYFRTGFWLLGLICEDWGWGCWRAWRLKGPGKAFLLTREWRDVEHSRAMHGVGEGQGPSLRASLASRVGLWFLPVPCILTDCSEAALTHHQPRVMCALSTLVGTYVSTPKIILPVKSMTSFRENTQDMCIRLN